MGMAIQVCEHCNAAGQQIEGSKLSHLTFISKSTADVHAN